MPPKRSSSRSHEPAQRRPRIGRACHFCRITKQRCDPSAYGTIDRPCRRCVSQGLNCNIPQAAHPQSPSSGSGAQGLGPVRNRTTPRSGGGATEELTQSPETNVQHARQQSESVQVPMKEWPTFMMRPDEQQGSGSSSTVLSPGQTQLQTQNFFPPVPSMGGYPQSFPNVAQGSANLESIYYTQDYYGQIRPGNTYMADYTIQGASDGVPDLGYTLEESQPDNEGAFADEEDYSRSDEF